MSKLLDAAELVLARSENTCDGTRRYIIQPEVWDSLKSAVATAHRAARMAAGIRAVAAAMEALADPDIWDTSLFDRAGGRAGWPISVSLLDAADDLNAHANRIADLAP